MRFTKPVAYQEGTVNRKQSVVSSQKQYRNYIDVAYVVNGNDYGFKVGNYDPTRPLVIDPLLQSTYLGGNGSETGQAIAIHPTTGDIYITGVMDGQVFVSRLSSDLTTLLQTTLLGGSDWDEAYGIAIHPNTGEAYVTGVTNSTNFPNITGGADTTIVGDEAFVSRLSSNLRTIYRSTFLGGSKYDSGAAIAIHPTTGNIYVTGTTGSNDFPHITDGADTVLAGDEAYVSRLSRDLGTLYQSTFLGGSGGDSGFGIAIHPTQGIYVTGHTFSNDFPNITNGADTTFAGSEAFVSRLSGALNILYQSTFLGGRSADTGVGIAIHPTTERIYVTGSTGSSDFPNVAGGADTIFSDWTFTTEAIRTGNDNADNQEDLGASANDFILQYGKGQSDTQSISGADGNDWLEQDGGEGNYIHQSGGVGNDILKADGQDGDDLVIIDAGQGNDTITYSMSAGADEVFIDGGTGNDSLTINAGTQTLTLRNVKGEILFKQGTGGSEIWVRSVENITVLDPDEVTIFEITDATDLTGGPDTSYREVVLGEAFVAMFDNLSSLYTLTVTRSGNGSGTVTGPGINCGFNCKEAYTPDTPVTLTATADTDSIFAGWSGDPDCSDGQVTMNADKTCIATFNLLLGLPDLTGTWVTLTSSDGGKSVSGTLALSNIGLVSARRFRVAFSLSADGC